MLAPKAGMTSGGDGLPPELLASAIAAAPIGIVVTDARRGNVVVYVNDEFTAITGYAAGEVLGQTLSVLQGAGTDRHARDDIAAAVAAGREISTELLNYRKNGQPFWMKVHIRPMFDDQGTLTHFVGGLSDMTERRLAEDAVREKEERLRAIADAVPLPMVRLRPNHTVAEGNQLAHETLGVPPGQLIGRDIHDFHLAGDPSADLFCERLTHEGRVSRMEIRARRLDGTPVWLLASAQSLTVRGENSSLLTFQDLTDLKRREEALQQANEQAERTIRARMRFLAAASHDLRQPLQALALFASALDNHVKTPQARTIVQSMKTSLRGMEEMFDALLDMSKLDAGVMKSEPQVFLINDIFERLETDYGPQAEAAGLELCFVPSSAAVKSDPKLLSRVIGNFLSNAIRYTREGRILVGCRLKGSAVRVMVLDTGPGIPEGQRLEIFKEFRQGDAPTVSGRGVGMGLGLAIVQRLARLLNHPLDVRSIEGRGSAFSIDVPLAEEWLPSAVGAVEDEDVRAVEGATVVVVDDDPDIQDGLKLLLEEWGCHPVVAATADLALAELEREGARPDVILADLHLRNKGSGVAAIKSIHQRTGAGTPAFLFTGDTEASQATQGDGEFRVLRKPIDPMRLRTVLADALGR